MGCISVCDDTMNDSLPNRLRFHNFNYWRMSCVNTPIGKNATYSLRQKSMTLSQSFTQCDSVIITDRKGRLCFQRRLSVILSTGGSALEGSVSGGLHTVGSAYRRVCTDGVCIWRGSASRKYASMGSASGVLPNHPILTSSGGHSTGRYASYWNAFLFQTVFAVVSFSSCAT